MSESACAMLSPSDGLKVVLVHPQIAPNTGNIARLCVATGASLHLVRPLGFIWSDREVRRSGMDYLPRLDVTFHDDLDALVRTIGDSRAWLFSSKAVCNFWEAEFAAGDWLILGSETAGLPTSVTTRFADRLLRIPQVRGERCLNLSSAAAIGLFEALRQVRRSSRPDL